MGKADRHIDGTDSAGTFLPDHYADLVAHLRARTFTKAPEVVAWVLQRLADGLTPYRILGKDQSPAKETVYKIERARTSGQLDAFERYLDTRDIEPIRAANRAAHRATSRSRGEARRPSGHQIELHVDDLTDVAIALAGNLAVVRPLSAAETSPTATVEGTLVVSFWAHLGSNRHERYLSVTAALRSYHEQCGAARDITIDRARSALPWLEGDNLAAFVNGTFTRAVDRAQGRPPVPPSLAGVELVTGAAAGPVLRMGSGAVVGRSAEECELGLAAHERLVGQLSKRRVFRTLVESAATASELATVEQAALHPAIVRLELARSECDLCRPG